MIVFDGNQISLLKQDSIIFENSRNEFINQIEGIENIGQLYREATQSILMSFYFKSKILNYPIPLDINELINLIHNFITGTKINSNSNIDVENIKFDIIFDLKEKSILNTGELPDNYLISIIKELEVR